jgi:RNA polymerase sigma factor (sigma-70 family)
MSHARAGLLLRHVRHIAAVRPTDEPSDRELLARFAQQRDEAAFAELLRRHSRMVLQVCRRILHRWHDAEDACQATFLVLAAKAGSLAWQESVANWLYGVARNVARRAKAAAASRHRGQGRDPGLRPADPLAEITGRELHAALDEELARLPDKYRAPLVLCYLEGATRDEAARQLGWPLGTLKSRVERGRALLGARLARRGLALSAALSAGLLTANTVAAGAYQGLTRAALLLTAAKAPAAGTVSASALALAKAALHGMSVVRFKIVTILLAAAVLLGSTGLAAWRVASMPEEAPAAAGAPEEVSSGQTRVDFFGDPLPHAAVARMGSVRLRHGDWVHAVALSPDGKLVASVGGKRYGGSVHDTLTLWDATTGKELRRFPGRWGAFGSLAFLPDGRYVVLADSDKTVHMWDVWTGRERWSVPGQAPIALSPDGKRLAIAGTGRTRLERFQEREQAGRAWDKAFDRRIAAMPLEQTIQIWDVAKGRRLWSFPAEPRSLAFSPNGRVVAAALADRLKVCLWDVQTGKELREFGGATLSPGLVAYSPDGKVLAAAGGAAGDHGVWNIATGKELWCHKEAFSAYAQALAFSPDGKYLASSGSMGTRFWDPATGRELPCPAGLQSQATCLAFSADGKTLSKGDMKGTVYLLDVASGRLRLGPAGHQNEQSALAVSPDGKVVATGSRDRTIRLWDLATGKERATLQAQGIVASLAFSADGKELLSRSDDGKTVTTGGWTNRFRAWDLSTARPRELRHMPFEYLATLAPDGRRLARADGDTVRVEDVATGKELLRLGATPYLGNVGYIAFSGDGRKLAAGGRQEAVVTWDAATGKELSRFGAVPDMVKLYLCGEAGSVFCFSHDARILVTRGVDRSLSVWDVAAGRRLRRFPGEESPFVCAALSPDCRTLATARWDGTIGTWEVVTGGIRRQFRGHIGGIAVLQFSPDGKYLISGGRDGTALVWDVTGAATGPPPGRDDLAPKDLEALWTALADADAARAHRAAGRLLAAPRQAVPLLRVHLRPVAAVEEPQMAKLLGELGADSYAVREQAARRLEELEELALPALRAALAGHPAPEVRRRIERLLEDPEPASRPALLRGLRAAEVLEQVGTPQATEVLRIVAAGAAAARLTKEAKASLDRLTEHHQAQALPGKHP